MFKQQNKKSTGRQVKFDLPKKNKSTIIIQDEGFSALHVLRKIKTKEEIQYLKIISYRIGKHVINALFELCEDIEFIMSDSIKTMTPDVFKILKNKKLTLVNIHLKMAFVKTNGNYYVVKSSNNIGSVKKIDYSIIFNNQKIYNKLWGAVTEISKQKMVSLS